MLIGIHIYINCWWSSDDAHYFCYYNDVYFVIFVGLHAIEYLWVTLEVNLVHAHFLNDHCNLGLWTSKSQNYILNQCSKTQRTHLSTQLSIWSRSSNTLSSGNPLKKMDKISTFLTWSSTSYGADIRILIGSKKKKKNFYANSTHLLLL